MNLTYSPLLAVDAGTVVSIVFLVIAFLSWIINLISGQAGQQAAAPKRPPPARRPKPGDERIQSEIEVFLEEVGANRPPQARPVPQAPGGQAGAPPFDPRTAERAKRKQTRKQRPRPAVQPPPSAGARAEVLGGKLREHVTAIPPAQVPAAVEPVHRLGQANSAFGDLAGPMIAHELPSDAAIHARSAYQNMAAFLNSPDGVRQAIVANEILKRPKALERR